MNKVVLAIGVLAIGLVVLFGLYLFLKGVSNIQMATSGTVVRSETTRSVTSDRRMSPARVSFSTRTVIRYAVNAQEYTTGVLHFGQTLGSDDKSAAALLRLRYPEGKDVMVSYDPASPSTGVMEPGLHAEAFWLPGAGVVLLPASVATFIWLVPALAKPVGG